MKFDGIRRRLRSRLAEQANATAGQGIRNATDFLVYALVGAVVGGGVAIVEWVAIEWLLHDAEEAPRWALAVLPGIGLVVTAVVLRLSRTDSSTSDEYIKAFHGDASLPPRDLPGKLAAATATLGSGGALGFEGPAVHLGATVGRFTGARLPRYDGPRHRALLVAGAAAGVSAVFKAPATGVLFALESPYRRDLARHALLPALVASAAAYLVFVPLIGDDPLLRFRMIGETSTSEILGALLIGLLGGFLARATARLFRSAKDSAKKLPLAVRLPGAAAVLAASVLISLELVEESITFGPGAEKVVDLVLDPQWGFWVILAILGLRILATSATLVGGGVGGLFIPLVVVGMLLGRLVEIVVDEQSAGLFAAIGLASVLGAAYRTPLAAVMFVAETTGRAEFVIPALMATAVSQLAMGGDSVAAGQLDERKGRLERRLGRPVSEVTERDVLVVSPDDRLVDVLDRLGGDVHLPGLPVVSENGCDLLVLNDIASALFDKGDEAVVRDCLRNVPAVSTEAVATEAARVMATYSTAAVVVVDADGQPIGIVTTESIAGLTEMEL
ncbi:MAG: chloride channel protein [Actinomycetota bacterium]